MSPPIARLLAALSLLVLVGTTACEPPVDLIRRTQTDAFTQEIRKTVDILLVVDNSCSMVDEQIKLAANFDSFIEQFLTAEVNYQIGVVTTDVTSAERGLLVGETPVITSDMDVDAARALFQENVKVCANGSGFERGLEAARLALDPIEALNPDFLREDAALSIVFVSDEDDDSSLPVSEYLTFFKGLKGDRGYRDDTLINLSAVVGPPPEGCEQPQPVIPDCADGEADDEDGNIDCDAPVCQSSWYCTIADQVEVDCGDGIDNEGDGVADCDDADCAFINACHEIGCFNGTDDDGDGDIDCADIDCLVGFPGVCGEISCDDEDAVHVGNQYPQPWAFVIDCDDPSCFAHDEACFGSREEIDFVERCDEAVRLDPSTGSLVETDGPDVDSLDGQSELAGCDDPDCASYFLCSADLRIEGHDQCNDCQDNDGDGLEDCEDTDCLDSPFCDNPYPIEPGLRYIDVALRSGGIITSICSEEFSGLVRELGLNISGLRSIFYLTAWPDIPTIAVYLDEIAPANLIEDGWEYDPIENRILFVEEAIPSEDSVILINYVRSSTPPIVQAGLDGDDEVTE